MDNGTPRQPRVLIADDQQHVREALQLLLRTEGMATELASSPDAVMRALCAEPFDLLLMDLNYARDTTSGLEGRELLNRVQAFDASLPVVALTGWATLDLAVELLRTGVRDFVQKPWDNARLMVTIRREIEHGRSRRETTRLHNRELANAQHIQRGLLPDPPPIVGGWTIAADWKPADGVGGDYFDVIPFGPTRFAICIADVVGKGVPAALLMSNLQAVVRGIASDRVAPAEVCAAVNRIMCGKMDGGRFITFFYGVLDTIAEAFTWANAGHPPPIVHYRDGGQELLSEGGMVAGVFPEAAYSDRCIPIHAGDRIVLYTDGITEAENRGDEQFGEERLRGLVNSHARFEPGQLRDAIFDAVSRFCEGPTRDDATVIVLGSAGGPVARPF